MRENKIRFVDEELVGAIIEQIRALEVAFQNSQALILTEDDLKCQLFQRIYSILENSQPTMNKGVTGSPLHAEVKFFDENGLLTIRPDLAIVETGSLSIYHSVEFKIINKSMQFLPLSSKQFEIGGNVIVIELKFCRSKTGISDTHIISYQKDIDKMRRLQQVVTKRSNGYDRVYGIFAVFNKTNKGKEKFDEFYQKNEGTGLGIVYGTANVEMDSNRKYPENGVRFIVDARC